MKFRLISDSCLTLLDEEIKTLNIDIVPLSFITDSNPLDDDRSEKQVNEMFENRSKGSNVSSSQPSPQRFLNLFKSDENILIITLSKKMSGTYNSARSAKEMCELNSNIYVLDSRSAGPAQDLIIVEALKQKDKMSFEDLCIHLENYTQKIKTLASMDDLNTLVASGRLSKTQGTIGSLLKVKPCLELVNGEITLVDKIRTQRKLIDYYANKINEIVQTNTAVVYISSINNSELVNEIITKTNNENIKFLIKKDISVVMAVNIGKGSMVLAIHVDEKISDNM